MLCSWTENFKWPHSVLKKYFDMNVLKYVTIFEHQTCKKSFTKSVYSGHTNKGKKERKKKWINERTEERMKGWMKETIKRRSSQNWNQNWPTPHNKLSLFIISARTVSGQTCEWLGSDPFLLFHFIYFHSLDLTWHICSSWDVLHQPGCSQEPLLWLQTLAEHTYELQISGHECEICFSQP
jgi:hypothetical protein